MTSGAEKIYKKLQELHPDGMATISDLSKNTNDSRDFIICNHKAFNFDLVKNITPHSKREIKERTPDALFLNENKLFFIEFKEGSCDKNEIRQKIYEGMTALYNFSAHHMIISKNDFMAIEIGYAVVNRYQPKGSPKNEVLDALKKSIDLFNLKNIEGFIVAKTTVPFAKESILKLLNNITGGVIQEIEYVEINGAKNKISMPI